MTDDDLIATLVEALRAIDEIARKLDDEQAQAKIVRCVTDALGKVASR
jgi:hypothetical protein